MKVMTKAWAPGAVRGRTTIAWKERGSYNERNVNFMAQIGRHVSNVHVKPKGGSSAKR